MKKYLLFITAIMLVALMSCDDNANNFAQRWRAVVEQQQEQAQHNNYPRKIKYEVTGTVSSVNITMQNSEGNTEQLSDVPVPWSKEFTVTPEGVVGYYTYISAQNNGDFGTVIVKIYVDGKVFKTATSNGDYVIADASGSVGGIN